MHKQFCGWGKETPSLSYNHVQSTQKLSILPQKKSISSTRTSKEQREAMNQPKTPPPQTVKRNPFNNTENFSPTSVDIIKICRNGFDLLE